MTAPVERPELVTKADREILAGPTRRELAEWWCELNSWRWPPRLPDEEPMEVRCSVHGSQSRRSALMAAIVTEIGKRTVLEVWNEMHPVPPRLAASLAAGPLGDVEPRREPQP